MCVNFYVQTDMLACIKDHSKTPKGKMQLCSLSHFLLVKIFIV